jgi:hypothetical protein
VVGELDGLGKIYQLLEAVAQKNEGKYLELLGHRPGDRTGQDENKAQDLEYKKQGESDLHRVKRVGRQPGKLAEGHTVSLEFNPGQRDHKDEDQKTGDYLLRFFVLPAVVQGIENKIYKLAYSVHNQVP